MTKKDFELIAKVFANNRPRMLDDPGYETWADCVYDMEEALLKTNPRFDINKFTKACKV